MHSSDRELVTSKSLKITNNCNFTFCTKCNIEAQTTNLFVLWWYNQDIEQLFPIDTVLDSLRILLFKGKSESELVKISKYVSRQKN